MKKLIICLNIISLILCWQQVSLLNPVKQSINSNNFKNYLLLPAQINNDDVLVIYGGIIKFFNQSFTDQLYLVNIDTQLVTKMNKNINYPKSLQNMCGLIIKNRLFVFGGVNSREEHSQFWSYNFYTMNWTYLFISNNTFSSCQLFPITTKQANDTVSILGVNKKTKNLQIIQYFYIKSIQNDIILQVYNTINKNLTLWDNSKVNNFLRVTNSQDKMLYNLTKSNLLNFPVKNFCVIHKINNYYTLVTNNGIYDLYPYNTSVYRLTYEDQYNDQLSSSIKCVKFQNWKFYVNILLNATTNKYYIVLKYFNLLIQSEGLINEKTQYFYPQWINQSQYFSIFQYKQSIYLINYNLQTFTLNQICKQQKTSNPNILKCFYGIFSCRKGYTGSSCSLNQCPGSLRILDQNNLPLINIQCSGNGICTQNGCNCSDSWAGTSCDIYLKKNCDNIKGKLIENFIASNCQCLQNTIGGNYCNVTFCYNDCAGKGTCHQDGNCICNPGYQGPDCSIAQIGLDLI